MVDPTEAQLPAGLQPHPDEINEDEPIVSPPVDDVRVVKPERPKIDQGVLAARTMLGAGIKAAIEALMGTMEPSNLARRLAQIEAVSEQGQVTLDTLGGDEMYMPMPKSEPKKGSLEPNHWWGVNTRTRRRIQALLVRQGYDAATIAQMMPGVPPRQQGGAELDQYNDQVSQQLAAASSGTALPPAYQPNLPQPPGSPGGYTPYNGSLYQGTAGQSNGTIIGMAMSGEEEDENLEPTDISDLTDDDLLPSAFSSRRRPERRETAGVRAMNEIVSAIGQIAGQRNLASDLAAYNEAIKAGMPELAAQIKARIEITSRGLPQAIDPDSITDALATATTGASPDDYEGFHVETVPEE